MKSVQENLNIIRKQILEAEALFSRPAHSVLLLAVSKGQSIAKIEQAFANGQQLFGENYLQEALFKMNILRHETIEWHFIGSIQANKTRKIAENFSWVHSVSSVHIAKRLHDQRPEHLPPLNVCLEVNVSDETTKSGVKAEQLLLLAEYCASLPRLKLRGLMAIPALKNTFAEQRAEYQAVQQLFQFLIEENFMLDTLSIGMSADFKAAIAEGATLVRIGTAIFGQR